MEQQFQLKYHGKLDLFEQNNMTSEDRQWFMERLNKELKEKAERERKSMPSISKPSIRKPSMPSRRR